MATEMDSISPGFYRECFNIAKSIFIVLDAAGRVVDINQKGCLVLGYSKTEILGKEWFETFLPSHIKTAVREVFDSIVSGRKEAVEQFENEVMTKSGEVRLIAWRNTYLKNKTRQIIGSISSGEDLTDTRRTELERDRLFNYSLDMLCVAGFDGYMKDVNPAWLKALGWTQEELISKPWIEFVHPDDIATTEDALAALVHGQEVQMFNNRYRCKDDTYRWISWNAFPLMDEQLIFAVARDITEKRAVDQQLRESREKLLYSEKMEAIGRLAGGVAHDFNNQLASIVGCADLLRDSLSNRPDLVRYTDIILSAAEYSATLTNQLLAFARKGKYQIVKVDIHQLIEEVLIVLERSIDKEIVLHRELTAKKPFVKGDPSQLKNALLNIAINARDAMMPDGGIVRIRTSDTVMTREECERQRIDASPGPYIRIDIEDTGAGMDEETLPHLFEPFFTTKGAGRGTGLGLASVYGTVSNHKGAITVASTPGKGSRFSLFLPKEETRENRPVVPERKEGGRATVLLVDDEQTVLEAVEMMLQSLNLNVITCRNGPDALDAIQNSPNVDLVILDLVMPDWNGIKTYGELRKINPNVKVLLSSGYSLNGDGQQLLAFGASGFLKKPFRKNELLSVLQPLLA